MSALLKNGADPELRTDEGDTAMLAATRYQQVVCLSLLFNAGADILCVNNDGSSPLIVSATNGFVTCSMILLQLGAGKSLKISFHFIVFVLLCACVFDMYVNDNG